MDWVTNVGEEPLKVDVIANKNHLEQVKSAPIRRFSFDQRKSKNNSLSIILDREDLE